MSLRGTEACTLHATVNTFYFLSTLFHGVDLWEEKPEVSSNDVIPSSGAHFLWHRLPQ